MKLGLQTSHHRGWPLGPVCRSGRLRTITRLSGAYGLQSKLLKGSYLAGYIGSITGVIKGILGVQTMAHIGSRDLLGTLRVFVGSCYKQLYVPTYTWFVEDDAC